MKKFFDKSNFTLSSFDEKQKRQSLVVSILVIVSFVVASFTLFNALYAFSDIVGCIVSGSPDVAIKDALRSMPLFLTFLMSIWILVLFHTTFRRTDEQKWRKGLVGNSICIIALAGINIIYVIAGLIVGKYASIVEGAPSALYPLDSVIFSLFGISIAVANILYIKKYEAKYPYLVPVRSQIVSKFRIFYCVPLVVYLLIALFGFAGGLFSIFIYDFMHEYAFYGVGVVLAYLSSPIILGVWEFYYNELKEEKKKEILLPLSLISTVTSIAIAAIYFISLGTDLDAPANAGFGMFPVTFSASVNIATLLVVFLPVMFSLVAVVKGLIKRIK